MLNADKVSAKLIELEDRSRRNNLRIDGIKEEPNDTWEACEKNPKIADKLGIDSDIKIVRFHWIGPCKTKTGQNLDRPCTVVCTLNRFKDKQRNLNNAKKKYEKHGHLYKWGFFSFIRTSRNLESHNGNKFWNIGNKFSHA